MKQPIPVTLVSGFLGSGKTTLLCDLLEHRQERRLAVLINELGEISIDGALARASAGGSSEVEIVDFPSGLIAYADDTRFVPTLEAIARRAERVDHVLIETSGVALPSAAMERLQSPELAANFVLDATLVVVDTPRLLAGEFRTGKSRCGVAGESGKGRCGDGAGGVGPGGVDARGVGAGGIGPGGVDARGVGAGGVGPGGVGARVVGAGGIGPGGVDARGVGAGDSGASGVGNSINGDRMAESAGLLFDEQLAGADVVVLNKIDDLDTDALLAAEEQVRRRAPNVRFLELAHNAQLDARLALGLRLHQATARRQHFHGPFAPMPGVESRPLADQGPAA